jgi:hypothetical protein
MEESNERRGAEEIQKKQHSLIRNLVCSAFFPLRLGACAFIFLAELHKVVHCHAAKHNSEIAAAMARASLLPPLKSVF